MLYYDALTEWFLDYMKNAEEILRNDNNVHLFDDDELISLTDMSHPKPTNILPSGLLSHTNQPQRPTVQDCVKVIQKMIDNAKSGKEVVCCNCKERLFGYRTGKYGEFLYCSSCKATLSVSSFLKKVNK